jgi:Meckel syndrome type 1 protein
MLWNPHRDTHILAWQGALGSLLAMSLVVLVVILVGGPEKGWQGTVPFPTVPVPVPGSRPDSRLSQPPTPAPLQASEGSSEPALASARSELAAADNAVAPGQVPTSTSELPGRPAGPAPATSAAGAPPPAAADPEPAAGSASAAAGLPPAPAVGAQASVKASIPGPLPPPVTASAPRLPEPPQPSALPLQPHALPAVPAVPPTPRV